LTTLYITYQSINNNLIFSIQGWNNGDCLTPSIRNNSYYDLVPTIPKYIYFAHPTNAPIPSSKLLANYSTITSTQTISNTCDDFNFDFGGSGLNVDRINLESTITLIGTEIIVDQNYVINYLLDSNNILYYAFMTPNSVCGSMNPKTDHCWCPVLGIQVSN